MSIAVMTEVWKHAPVAGTELLMLLALADSANDDRECWPSVRHLSEKTRLSIPQVRRLLTKLAAQKLIHKAIQKGKGAKGRETNLYTILTLTPITHDSRTPITHDSRTPITDDSLNHHLESSKDSSPSGDDQPSSPKTEATRPANPNAPLHDELLRCFGLTPQTVTKTADRTYWVATADLARIEFPLERVQEFYTWCVNQGWKSFSVMAMAKHAGEWLANGAQKDTFSETLFSSLTYEQMPVSWRAEHTQEEFNRIYGKE